MDKQYVDLVHTLLHWLCEDHGTEPGFTDVSELSDTDKAFMLITSCAELQAALIWALADDSRLVAEQGLELLCGDLKKALERVRERQHDEQRSN